MAANGLSDSYAMAVINTIFRPIGSPTYRTAVFGLANANRIAVGLHTANPGVTTTAASEVPTNVGYGRVYLPLDNATWAIEKLKIPGQRVETMAYNRIPIVFGPCLNIDWGIITHYSLHSGFVDGAGNKVAGLYIGYGAMANLGVTNRIKVGMKLTLPGASTFGYEYAGLIFKLENG